MSAQRSFVLVALAISVLFLPRPLAAREFKVLYSFCSQTNCADGAAPESGLVIDSSGNLIGATSAGGTFAFDSGMGTVFELLPDGANWTYKLLYNFCQKSGQACPDGQAPTGNLLLDKAGNVYGITRLGGGVHHSIVNGGVAFEVGFNASTSTWVEKHVHEFCPDDCRKDGFAPVGGLTYDGAANGYPYDGASALYGVTRGGGRGGSFEPVGVAFELLPVKGKKRWSEHSIHNFCSRPNCKDGGPAAGALIPDGTGNLLGTTQSGGRHGSGTVFQLTRGNNVNWSEHVIADFCKKDSCSDGAGPSAGLLRDPSGNLFGMTAGGGKFCSFAVCGTVFRLSPAGSRWTLTTLHSFCAQFDCRDGRGPNTTLVMDAGGNLYGTTLQGGDDFVESGGAGVVFKVSADGKLSILHRFCAARNCADGDHPQGTLTLDSQGNLFGTTNTGGAYGQGVVYEITP